MLKALDDFIFAMASHGMGNTVITIEKPRKDAMGLCYTISKEIEPTLKSAGRDAPEIWLGTVFTYRGVKFRIVETAL